MYHTFETLKKVIDYTDNHNENLARCISHFSRAVIGSDFSIENYSENDLKLWEKINNTYTLQQIEKYKIYIKPLAPWENDLITYNYINTDFCVCGLPIKHKYGLTNIDTGVKLIVCSKCYIYFEDGKQKKNHLIVFYD